ncbi:MAG: Ig-like domain-containing protein [Chitinispirillaceae bacterium]|nr:Ig-like domain-containing protein [Chitinispirillaceae bacterium]
MRIIGTTFFPFRCGAAAVILSISLFLLTCELGDSPLAPKITGEPDAVTQPDSVNSNMRIRALPSALPASYDESAVIEVVAFDDNRNPLAGKEVLFSTTKGTISAKDTTCAMGIATAVFTAEPANENVVIYAKMILNNTLLTVATTVKLSGVTVTVAPQILSAPLKYPVPVTVTLLDGQGKPLPDRQVKIRGSGDSTKTTNGSGEVFTVASRSSKGSLTISAQALGVDDSATIYFGSAVPVDSSNNNMRLRALPSFLAASYDESAILEVTVFDDNHNPLAGREVTFTATKGLITARDSTDGEGIATAVFSAEPINDNAIIYARTAFGDSILTVATAVTLSGVALNVLPQLTTAPLGYQVPVRITLLDGKGAPLPDRRVRIQGMGDSIKTTNGAGEVSTVVSRPSQGTVTINAHALGASDSATVFFGSTAPVDSSNRYMRIRAFPSALLGGYDDTSTIEVAVFDDSRNPVVGKEIMFTASNGTISALDSTDCNGIALATFKAEPLNGNVIVSAKMKINDTILSVATTVTLSGIAVIVIPELSSAPLNTAVNVKIKLLDGKGLPLPDQRVRISGNGDSTKTTDGAGEVATAIRRSSKGTITIRAEALGAVDSASVFFGTEAPVDNDNTIRSMRLFSSHSQLRADNSAEATITAIIISEDNHNPLVNETVQFSATLGIIDQWGATDSSGRTSVTLRSAPINGTCVIRAALKGNSSIKDSTSVLFSGVILELSADRNDLCISDTARVRALLKDGSGNPISSDFVSFTITAPGVFTDNTRLARSALNASGIASIAVTSGIAGKVTAHGASANVADSIVLTFTTNNLSVYTARDSLVIGGRDSTQVSARYLDKSGKALAGKIITFATNAGSLTAQSAVTDGNGVATTYLKSGYFAADAAIQAKAPDGSAYTTVRFHAAAPGSIALAITPDNIGINGGIAVLIATVKDDSGNVVSGAEVSFKILKGPGGGEQIDKPIIVSTNDGIARTRLLAGALPSTYRGCEVEAKVAGIVVTSKLTISGEPHTITISRSEDDTVKVPNGGHMDESTFEFFIGAVVQDVNGNPVADGTPVNFSAVVSGLAVGMKYFDRWETKDGDVKPITDYRYYDIPFEDINGNFKFDPGIDLDLDAYPLVASRGNDRDGDGVLEYGITANGFFWDFNGNGICDTSSNRFNGEPYYGALKVTTEGDTIPDFYADLNANGRWDRYEWVGNAKSTLPPAAFTTPLGFDFEFWRWEVRKQFREQQRLDFIDNDFALVIDRTATTKDGVAHTQLTYPRQFANRLIATVNAEVKGIRDRDGERFRLPVVRE